MQFLLINHMENTQKRQHLLDAYKQKQDFRVSIGKSQWVKYETFNPLYNLREILHDEIVVEFDTKDFIKEKKWADMTPKEKQEFWDKISWPGIMLTAANLYKAGKKFTIWDHGGISPHLHVQNLAMDGLDKDQRRLFKKIFVKHYVPEEYLPFVDLSLCGIKLIALEYASHWKKCYGVKELLASF